MSYVLPATLAAATALFGFGFAAGRRSSIRSWTNVVFAALGFVAAIPCLLFVLYYTHAFDNAAWFYNFRAMPYTELAAAGIGILAGFAHGRLQPGTPTGKLIIPTFAVMLIVVPYAKPILAPVDPNRLANSCPDEVCLQHSPSTCGPASAATLLKLFGKATSEKQLALECFTSAGGTESWYLARALRNRGLQATFVTEQNPARNRLPFPSIAGVRLRGGSGHFIAILNVTPDTVVIGDPLKGKLVVRRDEMERYYRFTGLFLVVSSVNSPVTYRRCLRRDPGAYIGGTRFGAAVTA